MSAHAQGGQSSTEFLMIAGVLVVALFYPFSQQGPVFIVLVQALMSYLKAQTFALSIL